jgi:hypothetical protein
MLLPTKNKPIIKSIQIFEQLFVYIHQMFQLHVQIQMFQMMQPLNQHYHLYMIPRNFQWRFYAFADVSNLNEEKRILFKTISDRFTARKSIGIFAKRLQATTCAKESERGLCRANNPLILDFPSGEMYVIPL